MGIKIYKMKDIIRKDVTGDIDLEKSKKIIRNLARASLKFPRDNILIDLRGTTVSSGRMADAFPVASEFMNQFGRFENRIASIVPNDEERISLAKFLETCLTIKNYRYKVFTNFEEAIEWLSEISSVEEH